MREYLFRGKQVDRWEKGKWAEGYLKVFEGNAFIYVNLDNPYAIHWAQVDPETVGQYTGLTDKNGVRIFEGDILEDSLKQEIYTVNIGEYNQCDTCFDDEEKAAYGCYTVDSNGFEESIGHAHIWAIVIGNIYDNPELLKEGGEE